MLSQDFFRSVDLFKYLTESQLELMVGIAVKVAFPIGEIIRENDAPDGVYIVESGVAKVTKSNMNSSESEAELGILRQGSSFGELSTIDGLPRSANVTATEPVTCYFLPRNHFLLALKENPEIGLAMLHAFANMVRGANIWASFDADPPQDSQSPPPVATPVPIASAKSAPTPTPEHGITPTPSSTPFRSFRL